LRVACSDTQVLDYMHARYYNSNLGRSLSVDPVGNIKKALKEPQRWNRFAYVQDNPLRLVDPDGKESAEFALDRDVRDLMAHRITEQQYWSRINARAAGAGIGAAFWSAVFLGSESAIPAIGDAVSSLFGRFVSGPAAGIAARILGDPNRLDHIFGNEGHNLAELTERLGGESKVVGAVAERLGQIGAANLQTNSIGIFSAYISVGGEVVEVTGRVINGVIYVSNFWVPVI
jgi:RHS repeat-associated protein